MLIFKIKQDARLTLCVSFPMFHSKDRHDRVLLTSPIVLLSVAYRTNLQITKHTVMVQHRTADNHTP